MKIRNNFFQTIAPFLALFLTVHSDTFSMDYVRKALDYLTPKEKPSAITETVSADDIAAFFEKARQISQSVHDRTYGWRKQEGTFKLHEEYPWSSYDINNLFDSHMEADTTNIAFEPTQLFYNDRTHSNITDKINTLLSLMQYPRDSFEKILLSILLKSMMPYVQDQQLKKTIKQAIPNFINSFTNQYPAIIHFIPLWIKKINEYTKRVMKAIVKQQDIHDENRDQAFMSIIETNPVSEYEFHHWIYIWKKLLYVLNEIINEYQQDQLLEI